MNNKEKYINYIVDDMVSKTKVDRVAQSFRFPYSDFYHFYRIHNNDYSPEKWQFINYVTEWYGVREEEMETIWDKYYKVLVGKI